MRTEVKAAIAGTVGVVLLLGGAGTLAYWEDAETIGGGSVKSGSLTLTQETGQSCTSWSLDSTGGSTTYTPGTTLLVPGDSISRTCTYTVTASGAHLAATLGIEAPTFTTADALSSALDVTASYTLGAAAVVDGADITTADSGKVLTAAITVIFDSATSGTTAQAMTTALNDITVSLKQSVHP